MDKPQVIKILTLVKGVWPRQPTDDPTIAVWVELLRDVPHEAAREAVREFIDIASHDGPTLAEIRKLAMSIDADATERTRRARKALMEPPPNDAEVARNVARLREIRDGIAQKYNLPAKLEREQRQQTANAHGEIARQGPLDAETAQAQAVVENARARAAK